MSAPVWVLSVDLQTKTATFQSGMAEAAKSARGAFTDIKSGADEMGGAVGSAAGSARQSVMLLGDEFGVHLPRGLTMFISSLGPVGPAMEAAFPFVAIALGATLLIQHLMKLKEEGQKLTEDQVRFGTSVQNAFNNLDQRLLQAGIKADELRNDHIGALHKELELINAQSMSELVHSFAEVSKAADLVFADLNKSWYQIGSGSAGAKHSLDEFTASYESLLAKGDAQGASKLLNERLDRETKILALQKQATLGGGYQAKASGGSSDEAARLKFEETIGQLKAANSHWDKDAITAQEKLVQALADQVTIEGKVGALKKQDSANATTETGKTGAAQASAAAKAAADSQLRIGEQSLAADRATSAARLAIARASIAERTAADIAFADRELQIEMTGNAAQIAALDKMAADYPNALKSLHEKAEELTAQHAAHVTEITAKAAQEQAAKDLTDLEQGEREKIEATQQGSAARLAAIDSAMKTEAARNMQDTNAYRELLTQRVETVRAMAEEEAKLKEEAGKEAAASDEKMGQLALAAEREHQAMLDSAHHISIQMRMAEDIDAANQEYALKLATAARDIAALDKSGKDYENKLKEIQDKQKQLVQEHENEITAIKDKAEIQRNTAILAAEQRAASQIASGLTQSIMGHQTWAKMLNTFASQAASGLIQNSLMVIMQQDKERLSNARTAATSAYKTGESIGGPAGIILGPVFAAAAFAGAMAFESGGVVPGIGRGDTVPAMLTPGEGVVPGGVMDGLSKMARSGTMGQGPTYHAHMNPTYNLQALDADGMDKVLAAHSATLTKHVETTLRKMNR